MVVVGMLAGVQPISAPLPTPRDATDAVLILRHNDAWAWAVGISLIGTDLVFECPKPS